MRSPPAHSSWSRACHRSGGGLGPDACGATLTLVRQRYVEGQNRACLAPFVEAQTGQIGEGAKPIDNPRTLPFGDPLSRQLNGPPRPIT